MRRLQQAEANRASSVGDSHFWLGLDGQRGGTLAERPGDVRMPKWGRWESQRPTAKDVRREPVSERPRVSMPGVAA